MKRILYWDGYGLGAPHSGIFVHARNLATELGALGCEPKLVATSKIRSFFPELPGINLPDVRYGRRFAEAKLFWSERVRHAVAQDSSARDKPKIIHGLSNFNVPWRGDQCETRRVLTIHDLIPLLAPRMVSPSLFLQLRVLLPRAVAAADRIVCVSEWTLRSLLAWAPEAAAKSRVIPNGVCHSPPRPRRLRSKLSRIHLLFVARFERYKGHAELLAYLRSSRLALQLTLITDPKGHLFCRTVAQDLLQNGSLVLRPNVFGDELQRAYAAADIYVSPSHYEGFCLPAVEAMRAGIPVVYRSGSGIDEVAGQDVNIAVGDATSIDAWDDAIEAAWDRSSRADFAAALAAYVNTLPTWKDAASRLLSLYNELV